MDDREWRRYPHIVHHSGQWYVERIDNDPEYALGRFGHTVCYGWADANGKLWDVTRTVALSDTYVGMVEREYIKYANRNAGRSDGGAAVLRRARLHAHTLDPAGSCGTLRAGGYPRAVKGRTRMSTSSMETMAGLPAHHPPGRGLVRRAYRQRPRLRGGHAGSYGGYRLRGHHRPAVGYAPDHRH